MGKIGADIIAESGGCGIIAAFPNLFNSDDTLMRRRWPVFVVLFAALFAVGGAAAQFEGGFTGFFREQAAKAQFRLGAAYYTGLLVSRDWAESAKWWRRSAQSGYLQAQHNLGVLYYRGEGVARNHREAAKWFRIAGERGFAESQHNLGVLHRDGEGVRQDNGEAYVWFSLAAEQGFAESQEHRRKVAGLLPAKALAAAQAKAFRVRKAMREREGN